MIDYLNAKGYLTTNERQYLHDAARAVRSNGIIINIGVQYGASVACLRAGNATASIFAIDIDMSKANRSIPAKYIEEDSGVLPKTFPVEAWIDLLFVDGDHSFAGVNRDLEWSTLVGTGGHVIFHDCYDWPPAPPKTVHQVVPGVNRAVSEWYARVNGWTELDFVDTMRIFKKT